MTSVVVGVTLFLSVYVGPVGVEGSVEVPPTVYYLFSTREGEVLLTTEGSPSLIKLSRVLPKLSTKKILTW